MATQPDISVIICTRDRPDSLAQTLDCLARADRSNLDVEVIVVENGAPAAARSVVDSFSEKFSIRYLSELTIGNYGKSHALNRALESGGLGSIIAVLDDDMSPDDHWFQGIYESCEKWPQVDVFGGRTYVVWPVGTVPDWVLHPNIRSWAFSAADHGSDYEPLAPGTTFSGNHFWFRSRVLNLGRRFSDIWLTEPDFILRLTENGEMGMWSPQALAGHRIQYRLLEKDVVRTRAITCGRGMAELRIALHRQNKKVLQFKKHPVLCRIFCMLKLVFWWSLYARTFLCFGEGRRFALRLEALERKTAYCEMLKRANILDEYLPSFIRAWRQRKRFGSVAPK